MMEFLKVRDLIHKDIIEKYLLGPQDGINERIKNDSPLNFYVTGILYPQEPKNTSEIPINESDGEDLLATLTPNEYESSNRTIGEGDSTEEDEILLTSDFKPSAIGLSAVLDSVASFDIVIDFGIYKKVADPNRQEEINRLKIENPKLTDEELPIKLSYFERLHSSEKFSLELTDQNELIVYNSNGNKNTSVGNKLSLIIQKKDNEEWVKLNINKRKLPTDDSKCIITVTLTNELEREKRILKSPQFCIFQPQIKLTSEKPLFHPGNDLTDLEDRPEELKSLHLQYYKYASFASGHGCSVSWENSHRSELPLDEWLMPKKYVQTEIIPSFEVSMSDVDFRDSDRFKGINNILNVKRLLPKHFNGIPEDDLISELKNFIFRYKKWIGDERKGVEIYLTKLGVTKDSIKYSVLEEQALKNLNVCESLYNRMYKGIEILEGDSSALTAFRDANLSMYLQRAFSQYVNSKKLAKGAKLFSHVRRGTNWVIDYNDATPDIIGFIEKDYEVKWRPFQLAFLLAQIEGTVNPSSDDRDTTDLIWFSTGGGKTEAYLGLIAFTIFYRRLAYPNTYGGVTAIMRYTLRLLNKQQFGRAVPLICACELIRKNYLDSSLKETSSIIPNYGEERISIGIWVGSGLTPNKWDEDHGFWKNSSVRNQFTIEKSDEKYGLPLSECPCCGARLYLEEEGGQLRGRWGIVAPLVFPTGNKPRYNGEGWLVCTNSQCSFGIDNIDEKFYQPQNGESRSQRDLRIKDLVCLAERKGFPVYFVDDTIYKKKPTLLFSTIDKYAFINWREDSYSLFNLRGGARGEGMSHIQRPPELIIQDEMHLITSSLGSIYGVFEIAIDELCTLRDFDGKVIKPKIVTATATARNAQVQCAMLYGRKNFMQFPAPGIDADDSFYSKKKPVSYDINLSTYQAHGRLYLGLMASGFTNTVTQIRLVSVLNQLIPSLDVGSKELDYYYNVLAYFNTLKELGKFRTLAQDDIPAYRKVLGEWSRTVYQGYEDERFIELSSQLNGDQISRNLDHLEKVTLPSLPQSITQNQASLLYHLGIRKPSDIINTDGTIKAPLLDILNDRYSISEKKEIFNKLTGFDWEESNDSLSKEIVDRIKTLFNNFEDRSVCQITGATNMISVGVDIGRLNVMQVTGQPKMHAEYIQASSRVGRIKPGIVVTTYNSAKNRDRSHYERFIDYHRAFYKFVEATSVTPFSEPALEKALAGVIYAIMRKKYFGIDKDVQIRPDDSNEIEKYLQETLHVIEKRLESAGGDITHFENLAKVFQSIIADWKHLSENNPVILFPDFSTLARGVWDDKLYLSPEKRLQFISSNGQEIRRGVMMTLRNVEESSMVQVTRYN